MSDHGSSDRFDAAMRELHRDSLSHLGTDTRRRLRNARSLSTAAASTRRFGWPIASACAALFALAIAWPLRSPPPAAPSEAAPPEAVVAGASQIAPGAAPSAEIPAALAALEESPDFYLWLASSDAALDLLEQAP
ncbi:hypothetical protein ACFFGH_05035 [Lysobacter korlensis]|uniref:DUF3619 family protein n=1 Tax=Lysobacter korlensis TaxID=553636 RepID=A0ABV6RJQ3_9GAMM